MADICYRRDAIPVTAITVTLIMIKASMTTNIPRKCDTVLLRWFNPSRTGQDSIQGQQIQEVGQDLED
ncbi:unnamed protein product [Anisakis simplex]|uniref:Uncharacterized protein n=1 Tax=Anisakis simplex TaxID=6269 RepID=A0A0M3IZ62_ANISI|nr:unnamed protein product [Anisakis simplex]